MNPLVNSSNAKHTTNRGLKKAAAICALMLLGGCGIPKLRGPIAPNSTLPDHFDGSVNLTNGTPTAENSSYVGWRVFYDDPILVGLIDQAIMGNQELKILGEEVAIAYNEIQARQGEYLPFVSFGSRAGLEKSSRFSRNGAVEEFVPFREGQSLPDPYPEFMVAANVRWELDIWKRLRNAKNAAALRYLGTQEGRNYVITRLVAEVTESYYELLALDARMDVLDATIQIQEQSLDFAQAMKDAARGTELAVQRFTAEVAKNKSEKFIIQQDIIETENHINFLLGRFPQPVERMKPDYLELNLHALNVGIPAQLLQNRADIREAERELEAAGLDVKVARARFYPSVALTADVGYLAFNAKYLFSSPDSLIYNVAGDLVAPLLNKKAIKADYMNANARQLQAIYDYQQTIVIAFTEVINRVSKAENYAQSIEIKKQQLAALDSSVENATNLFQNARAEYVEVLLAQRDMMEARMVLIETKKEQLSAIVNAYQALGGGGF